MAGNVDRKPIILVSAGHHPFRKGASFEGMTEFNEASIWTSLIAHYIGGDVMVVPTGVLKEKVAFINEQKDVSIAIEVHFNSAKNADGEHIGRGCETLYYPNSKKGIEAAKIVQSAMAKLVSPDRGIKEGYFRLDPNNGVDYFLAKTKCTSLIIEPEFIHRKDIIQKNRDNMCAAIAAALIEFSNT